MSLPTITALKDQANRLVTYLGDKHRFRLKAASALEAVAAIHKQPDWNTLQALAKAADEPVACSTGKVPESYPLEWGPFGPDYAIPQNDWLRHTLVTGADAGARRAWGVRQLSAQVDRGGGGVFINCFGGQLPREAAAALAEHVVVLDLADTRSGLPEYNLLRGLDPDQAAAVLVGGLFPPGDNSPGADFWKQVTNQVLTLVIGALVTCGQAITLANLLARVKDWAALERLQATCPEGAREKILLGQCIDQFRAAGGGPAPRWYSLTEVLAKLDGLRDRPWLRRLFSSAPGAPALAGLFGGERCVIVEMCDQDVPQAVSQQGGFLLAALRRMCADRMELSREARGPVPRVLLLAEVQDYLRPSLTTMAQQCRSAHTAILLTAPTEGEIQRVGATGEGLLVNTWNKFYLEGVPAEIAAEIARRLAQSRSALVSPSKVELRE